MEWTALAAIEGGYRVSVTVFRPRDRRPFVLDAQIWHEDGKSGPGVSADVLRSVKLAEILRTSELEVARNIEWGDVDGLAVFRVPGVTPEGRWEGGAPHSSPPRRRKRPTVVSLGEVAAIYSEAFAAGRPTGREVDERLHLNSPTYARQLIRRARLARLLPPTTERQATGPVNDVHPDLIPKSSPSQSDGWPTTFRSSDEIPSRIARSSSSKRGAGRNTPARKRREDKA
jgi:hypothetical protein